MSPLQLTHTKQWVAAFEASGWVITPEILDMAAEKLRVVMSSLCIEEFLAVAKNRRQARGSKRFRRLQRAMGTVLAANTLADRHKYDNIPADVPLPKKASMLTKAAFGIHVKGEDPTSIDLKGIATTRQKAPWYTSVRHP